MIILIALFLVIGSGNLIISVTPSNSNVSSNNQLAIRILTSTAIASNSLTISLTTYFALASPCLLNGSTVPCSFSSSTTAVTATIGTSLLANTFYMVTLNVTNAIYASNFQLTAAVSGVAFSNTGLITISAKIITCSLTPSSQLVGDRAIGYFQIGNDALPANSIISINSTLQTVFPNLFNSGPTCTIGNVSYTCMISTSFGQQFLTINSPPTSQNLNIAVSTINNPPYNSSFANIAIQIQNSAGFFMQTCSFVQQAVTTLRNSANFTLNSWNNQVGSISSVSATLSTYFKPYTTSLLWVFPNGMSVTALTPASGALTNKNTTIQNFITGASAVGNSLTFSAQINNPTSLQALKSEIYIVLSASQFIQRFTISTMTLTPLIFTPILSLSQNKTQYSSIYNVSISIPYSIGDGFSGSLSLTFGAFACSSLNLLSNLVLSVVSCSSNNLTYSSTSALPSGLVWIAVNVQNHFSTRSISLSICLKSPFPNYYLIGSGSASFNLVVNNHSFVVTNSNPVFAGQTSITVVQSSSLMIDSSVIRIVTLSLPKDLILSSSAIVSPILSSAISSYVINTASSSIAVNSSGLMKIQINNVGNPIKYLGSLTWAIVASDLAGNPSSSSLSQQSPTYTATTASLSYSFLNPVIQATNSMVLTIIPTLQYYTAPVITIIFSDSLILSCQSCTIISSTSLSVINTSVIMKVAITVKNSNHPTPNSISAVISDGVITYQTGFISYTLSPMTYGYVAFQMGMYQTVGNINITITSKPTQVLTLTYSDISPILSTPTCVTCTNSIVYLSGIVQLFQSYSVTITGTYNSLVYASAIVTIKYICQQIQGCNICVNQTVSGSISLICQQCFTSPLSPFYLLYNNQCLQKCPVSTYSNGITCVNCANLCYICTMTECQQCITGYYVYNNNCIGSCPSPMINNATHCIVIPIQCPSNCANCPQNNVCTTCDGGYYLLQNVCYASCPNGYIPSLTICIPFTPPKQTSYFPFPFVISSALIFIALLAMKCFEKRSLVMGNLIAFVSVVEVGSMILTLIYTLQSSQDLVTQALCFILLFSKILLNLIFLCYFLKIISTQQQFQAWKSSDEGHQRLYRVLITLCSIFSFQIIRIIYSRLLGLRLFFGKFNTSLIFKPLNYFTITYFLTSGAALVALSVRTILIQKGYRTSAFYCSIQSIIIQGILLMICIVDNKKGYDDQFFQYQVYKVNNQYEHSHIDPIDIGHQDEPNAGSMHEMLHATASLSKIRKKGSQIVRNPRWVKKIVRPLDYPQEEAKEEEIDEDQPQQNKEESQKIQEQDKFGEDNHLQKFGIIQNKKQSIFRRRIIEDWRKIQQSLPNKMHELRTGIPSKSKGSKHSISPQHKKKSHKKALRRVSSMQLIDLKLPEASVTIPENIKQYFRGQSRQNRKKNAQKITERQKDNAQQQKSINIEAQQESSEDRQQSIEGLLLKSSNKVKQHPNKSNQQSSQFLQYMKDEYVASSKRMMRMNNSIVEQTPSQTHVQKLSVLQKQQKQGGIQDRFSNYRALYEQMQDEKGQYMVQIEQNQIQFESGSQKRINLGNYRYKGEEQKQKQYRMKKRRVNRQTQSVYLQRLVASSDKKSRNLKQRKLQF